MSNLLRKNNGLDTIVTCSSSSSVGPVANTMDVLQLVSLWYSPYPPTPRLDVPTFAGRCPNIPSDARDTSSERGK